MINLNVRRDADSITLDKTSVILVPRGRAPFGQHQESRPLGRSNFLCIRRVIVSYSQPIHSRPQSPRSFWPAAGIENSGLVQDRKSAIQGLPVKSGKSDWLRIRNEHSAHAQKIGSGQSSRSLPQARRIVGSGDENAANQICQT